MISVIVPIYKVEKYLRRCIDSILNQSFTQIELILVNDGSPDGCGKICDEYLSIDSRVKVIHKENGGLSDARNSGLDIAKGEFIVFVDSDDFIHKDMIGNLYEVLIKTNSDIVQCKFKKFIELDEINKIENNELDENKIDIFDRKNAISYLINNNIVNVNSWNKIYKRKLFEEIRFPKGKIHEDEFVTYKLLYKANRIAYLDYELYYYFNNSNGIMKNLNLKTEIDRIEALEERCEFLLSNNEIELYNKSLVALFFRLLKVRYLIKRQKDIEVKSCYYELINCKIKNILIKLKNNSEISKNNKKIIKLININYFFVNIYDLNNFILEKKYKLINKFS